MSVPESDLLWWLGVVHSDCYVYKKDNLIKELRLKVSKSSIDMLSNWKLILDQMTKKDHKIHEETVLDKRNKRKYSSFCVRESSKTTLMELIENIPCKDLYFGNSFIEWIYEKNIGPYLAGTIDADGCIQIRKRYDSNKPEKLLKITDGNSEKLKFLHLLLSKNGVKSGYITDYSNYSDLWVYINKDLNEWLKINVAPYITIKHKLQNILASAAQIESNK